MRTVATLIAVALSFGVCAQDARGVRLVPAEATAGKFDRRESAALFVGVRDFDDPQLGGVKYTVDDAVDLAYVMAFEQKVRHADGRVGAWIRRNRDSAIRKAIQVVMDIDTKSMPLAVCTKPPNVAAVNFSGPSLTTFDQDGDKLWSRRVEGDITVAEPVDAASETLFMLDTEAAPVWSGTLLPRGQTIESLTTVDYDNDGDRDVRLETSAGTLHLTFAGEVLHAYGVQFQRTAVK